MACDYTMVMTMVISGAAQLPSKNAASNHLVGGKIPQRLGTAHPNLVPCQVFATGDGFIIITASNDGQFERLCHVAGTPELLGDPDFASNALREEGVI